MRIAPSTSLVITGSVLASSILWTPIVSFISKPGIISNRNHAATKSLLNDDHHHKFKSIMSLSSVSSSASNTQIKIPVSNLRSAKLTNINGDEIILGDKMGDTGSTSIVIFLRHMG